MDRIMAVVTKEDKYSKRFCDYVNRSGLLTLIAVPFTSAEKCLNYSKTHNIELLITEFDFSKPFSLKNQDHVVADIKAKRRMYLDISTARNMMLAEGQGASYAGENVVLKKYQSAEELLNGIVKNAGDSNILKMAASNGHRVDITGVYSSMTAGAGTAFALSLARESARKGRTLFMSFAEFTPVLALLAREPREGISEAMYQLKQEKLSAERINSIIVQAEWFDFICPVSDPDDVRMIQGEDCIALINEILSKTNYVYLVMELDRFSGQADTVMDVCDNVVVTQDQGSISMAQARKFTEYLRTVKNDAWMKKLSLITLNDADNERNDLSLFDRQFYGDTGRKAREFMEMKEHAGSGIVY